jgi:hypothetical protein
MQAARGEESHGLQLQVAEETNDIIKQFRASIRSMRGWNAYLHLCEMMCRRHNEYMHAQLQVSDSACLPVPVLCLRPLEGDGRGPLQARGKNPRGAKPGSRGTAYATYAGCTTTTAERAGPM